MIRARSASFGASSLSDQTSPVGAAPLSRSAVRSAKRSKTRPSGPLTGSNLVCSRDGVSHQDLVA